MKDSGRPMSPHVTIYSFPVTALSSITNRATGCALSFGCLGLGILDIFGGAGTSLHVLQTIGNDSGILIGAAARFVVAFPITYHYAAAIRHFYWDSKPATLTNDDAAKTSNLMFAVPTLLSAATMIF